MMPGHGPGRYVPAMGQHHTVQPDRSATLKHYTAKLIAALDPEVVCAPVFDCAFYVFALPIVCQRLLHQSGQFFIGRKTKSDELAFP